MPPITDMQLMERDMIANMYAEAFENLCDDPPTYSLYFSPSMGEPHELKATVVYPDGSYPDGEGSPIITVECVSKKHRIQLQKLEAELAEMAASMPGMPVVAMLCQHIQEFLSGFVHDAEKHQLQQRADAMAEASTIKVTVDPTIRMGNAVTKENFLEWQKEHLAAKRARMEEEERKQNSSKVSKLTGRQLWDTTIRNADWELFDADEDGAWLDGAGFDYTPGEEEGEEPTAEG
jgi:hypothetical protein